MEENSSPNYLLVPPQAAKAQKRQKAQLSGLGLAYKYQPAS